MKFSPFSFFSTSKEKPKKEIQPLPTFNLDKDGKLKLILTPTAIEYSQDQTICFLTNNATEKSTNIIHVQGIKEGKKDAIINGLKPAVSSVIQSGIMMIHTPLLGIKNNLTKSTSQSNLKSKNNLTKTVSQHNLRSMSERASSDTINFDERNSVDALTEVLKHADTIKMLGTNKLEVFLHVTNAASFRNIERYLQSTTNNNNTTTSSLNNLLHSTRISFR